MRDQDGRNRQSSGRSNGMVWSLLFRVKTLCMHFVLMTDGHQKCCTSVPLSLFLEGDEICHRRPADRV